MGRVRFTPEQIIGKLREAELLLGLGTEMGEAGRKLGILAILDEYARECLSLDVARQIRSEDVLGRLYSLFIHREAPEYIQSDNGPEEPRTFTPQVVQ